MRTEGPKSGCRLGSRLRHWPWARTARGPRRRRDGWESMRIEWTVSSRVCGLRKNELRTTTAGYSMCSGQHQAMMMTRRRLRIYDYLETERRCNTEWYKAKRWTRRTRGTKRRHINDTTYLPLYICLIQTLKRVHPAPDLQTFGVVSLYIRSLYFWSSSGVTAKNRAAQSTSPRLSLRPPLKPRT